jgi:hypothetical protein
MTSHELQTHGISKAVINRAVKASASEVFDEAVVPEATKQGRRLVRLYYLHPDQLETRKDRVYVPLSGLDERDQEQIDRYIQRVSYSETSLWMGNIERELPMDLSGPSETCRRRRDYLLKVARNKGIELREGVDEGTPVTGSRRWWLCHTEDAQKKLDELLANLPKIAYDMNDEIDAERRRRSLVGRMLECDQFAILESILKKPILEHLGAPILSKLSEIFARMKRTGSFDSMGFLRDAPPADVQELYEDMRKIIEKVGALEQEWFDSGLTRDCEECRSVVPKPSPFVRPQS